MVHHSGKMIYDSNICHVKIKELLRLRREQRDCFQSYQPH